MGISLFSDSKKDYFFSSFGSIDYGGVPLKKDVFYDLASLTKPLSTTLAVLSLIENRRVSLEDTLSCFFETLPKDKKFIKIKHLLGHCSGLAAYQPYFKELINSGNAKKDIIEKIIIEKLAYKTGEKEVYSDLGFILLGDIIEKLTSVRLDDYVTQQIYEPMALSDEHLFFNFNNREKIGVNCAPTEYCSWRKKVICGQVHDDNAYVLGGVAGHAGLFGNVYGVSSLVNFLIDIIEGKKIHPNIKKETLKRCIKRFDRGSFGLGFDTPSSENSSSGHFFSKKSFGHLGFTGTSFWVDMEQKISIILLTNRVHTDRQNNKIKIFRPVFHDTIMKLVGKKGTK